MAEILAFNVHQASRLTRLSLRQLGYWDETGFFRPTLLGPGTATPFSKVYSFKDIVGLRALAQMRKEYGIPLQQLRLVGSYLGTRYDEPWSALTFYIVGRQVYYQSEAAIESADAKHQTVMPFAMNRIEAEVRHETDSLLKRRPSDYGRIERNRNIAQNRPVLRGTRTPTAAISSLHARGIRQDRILQEYPRLTVKDVRAAIAYEAKRSTISHGRTRATKSA
ncbi:MAG: DUF433 domain-containing protein [Dehalococcoidia bacterium]